MKKIISFAFTISFALTCSAQIKGVILDTLLKKPVDKAVIGLVSKLHPADTSYYFADVNGLFSISPVPANDFTLVITNLGYRPVAKFIPVKQTEKSINVGTIILTANPTTLKEVVVEAAPIVIKEDTIEYRADAFKVKENATTEDLLKKLPGISVDKDGNVKAQGKDVKKIRVNGKEFFGGDVTTATRELPANIIDKVQVIDDYGDQATVSGIKDGEAEKVINLQIKKDKNRGFFGRITAGAGTDEHYQGSFNGNYFNNQQQISLFANSNNTNQSLFNFGNMAANRGMGNMMKMGQGLMNDMGGGSGLMNAMQNGDQSFVSSNFSSNTGITTSSSVGINYRDQWGKRISVYGSYSYSHRKNDIIQYSSTQNFYTRDTAFLNNQDNSSTTKGDNHRVFFNLEYQIDSFNYLKISPNLTYASSNNNSNTLFDYYLNSKLHTSGGSNNSSSGAQNPSVNSTILFNHKFRKRGRNFSANITLGNSTNNSDQNTNNSTSTYIIPIGVYNRLQYIDQVNDNHNYGIRLTYSEPLSKTRNLDVAYSHNLTYARNNKSTDSVDIAGVRYFIPGLSNDYENNFYSNRIGVSIRTTLKKMNYTFGISLQPVSQQGNSITRDSMYKKIDRVNIFPIARFAYNFSKTKVLNISYSGSATQPTYTQLQDVTDNSNQQSVTKGNPLLQPSINHNINAGYNNFNFVSGRVLFVNMTFSMIQNQIVNKTIRLGNSGAQLSIPENVNGYYNVLGFYTYSKPYNNRKYVITLTGTANYNHNINLYDNEQNVGNNWVVSQSMNFEFNYKSWLSLGTGVSYSLNDVTYSNKSGSISNALFPNSSSSAWTFSSNLDMDIPGNWVIKYDFDYTLNQGLNSSVSRDLTIFNASLEKQLFKKKNGQLKLAVYDIFNQNTNVSRSVTANSIVDIRSNKLARYGMLTFTYRLQKFKGQKPATPGFKGMGGPPPPNAEIKVF